MSKQFKAFSSGRTLSRVAVALLGAYLVAGAIDVGSRYGLLADPGARPPSANDDWQQGIDLLRDALLIIALVCFLCYIKRAYRNLPALGVRRLQHSPRWVLIWFFIPIANLVVPYNIVKDIWAGSNPDIGFPDDFLKQSRERFASKTNLLGLWWGFWIASIMAARFSYSVQRRQDGDAPALAWVILLADLVTMITAGLDIAVIMDIDARQDSKQKRIEAFREKAASE